MTTPRWLALAETALIVAGVAAYLAMPHEISSDGLIRLETTRYLARGEIIDAPYGLLMSALAFPLYHFGDVVAQFNTVVFLLGPAAIALLLRTQVPALVDLGRDNGMVYGQLDMSICNAEPNVEPYCWYTPEFSALFRPFIVPKTLTMMQKGMFGYCVAVGCVLAAPFALDLLRVGRDRLKERIR